MLLQRIAFFPDAHQRHRGKRTRKQNGADAHAMFTRRVTHFQQLQCHDDCSEISQVPTILNATRNECKVSETINV